MATVTQATTFKQRYTLDQRCAASARLVRKYKDRVPIIVEKAPRSVAPDLDKYKFLVPHDTTVGKFLYELRKQMVQRPENVFVYVGTGVLPPAVALVSQVHERYADADGFLYVRYASENTFGG